MSEKYFIISLSELNQLCSDTSSNTIRAVAFEILARPYKEPFRIGPALNKIAEILALGIRGLVEIVFSIVERLSK